MGDALEYARLMGNVVTFPRVPSRYVGIHHYDGEAGDRYVVVVVHPDDTWTLRSEPADFPTSCSAAQSVADQLAVRLDPSPIRAGTWSRGAE